MREIFAQKLRVLVVDDDNINRLVLRRFLKYQGHSVYDVEDGGRAIEVLGEQIFDMAFIDHILPQMTGTEVVRWARERNIRSVMVAITGRPRDERKEFLKAGFDYFLTKPCSRERILGVVRRYFPN